MVTSGLSRSVSYRRAVIELVANETSSVFGYFMIRRSKWRRRMMRRLPCTPHI